MKLIDNILNIFGYTPKTISETGTPITDNRQLTTNHQSPITKKEFSGAQTTHLTNDWNNVFDTINGSLYKGLVRLRGRSRDFAKNNPWARKYLNMLKKNVVGPDGFVLRNNATELKYDEKEKKWIREHDKLANQIIQEAWADWCLPKHCTVTKQISFREVTGQLLKTIAIDGEILVKPIRDPESKYGYRLQLIEADYLDETFNATLANGNIVVMGVEITSYREPVAYWLKKINPYNQLFYGSTLSGERTRIPVINEKTGLIQIKHLFVQETPNQLRGIPWFAPVAIRLKMYDGFEEAVLVDARMSANKTIKYEYKDNAVGDEINQSNVAGAEVKTYTDGSTDPSQLIQTSMPGEALVVPKGMTAAPVDYKSPSDKEGEFQRWAMRSIASGLDVSFIALANDYSQVNYTSSRTNLLEERDTWKDLHAWMRDHFLNWNYEEWLLMALLNQSVKLPLAKFEKFNKPWFQGRAWKWVSPKDEAEAVLLMVSQGAWLFGDFLAENGYTLEEWIDEMKNEKDLFKEAELPYPGSNYKQVKPIEKTEEPETGNNGNGKAKNLINQL